MSDKIRLTMELWNHGHYKNPDVPCGEVDVFRISGELIPFELLALITSPPSIELDLFEDFGSLPTELAIKVVADYDYESADEGFAGGWYANIISCEPLPSPPENES